MSTPRLQGGSESESVGDYSRGMSSMTHDGVNIFFPKKDKQMQVRLLPARDNSFSPADAAFATSVLPYRRDDGAGVDAETQTELFTSWFVTVRGYRFFGNSDSDFLSPLTLQKIPGIDPMMARDPINDIRNICRNDPQLKAYTDKGSGDGQYDAVVPLSSVYILFNALVNDGEQWHPHAEIYAATSAAFEDLKESLAVRRHEGCTNIPLDPVWGKYLLGDVTSLEFGAIANINKRKVGTVSPWCFDYTTNKQQSTGYYGHPMDPNAEGTQAILASRKDLLDSENVLKFMSYQEIVNLITADGSIPHYLIQQACGNFADIPNAPKQNTTVSSPEQSAPTGAPPGPGSAPGAAPPATPPGAAGPPAGSPPASPPAGAPPGGAPSSPPPATPPGAAGPPAGAASPPGGVPGGSASPPGGIPGGMGNPPSNVPGGASAGPPPGASAPPSSAPAPPTTTAPTPEAPTAPSSEEQFWASVSGNVVKKSRSEVQALIHSGEVTKVMSEDQSSGWVDGPALGFTVAAAEQPAPPAQPTTAETAPAPPPAAESAPAQPAAPTQEAAAAPVQEASPAAPPSGDGGGEGPLTDEELQFVQQTQALMTDTKTSDQVDGPTLVRFTKLNARGVKSGQIQPAG